MQKDNKLIVGITQGDSNGIGYEVIIKALCDERILDQFTPVVYGSPKLFGFYMKTIPDSLEEAAQMEGAGYLTVFWKIICPLCKPVLAATALFTAAFHWNSWFDALVFNRMRLEYTTLQYEIMKYLTQVMVIRTGGVVENTSIAAPILGTGATPQSLRCALVVISMLPILIIFPFFQKHFVSGLKVGGVKE